ncbi:hypothetical protein MCG01_05225 [Enterococcus hirae]|nr:hypothetical protein [Enterococcus hirae]
MGQYHYKLVNKLLALFMCLIVVLLLTSCSQKQETQKSELSPFLGTWRTKDHSKRLLITNVNASKNLGHYTILVKEKNHKIQFIDKHLGIDEQVSIHEATNKMITLRSSTLKLDYSFVLDSSKKLVFIFGANDGSEGLAKPVIFWTRLNGWLANDKIK